VRFLCIADQHDQAEVLPINCVKDTLLVCLLTLMHLYDARTACRICCNEATTVHKNLVSQDQATVTVQVVHGWTRVQVLNTDTRVAVAVLMFALAWSVDQRMSVYIPVDSHS